MKIRSKISEPALVAGGTVALCAVFWLPLARERSNRTTYAPFGGLATTFAAARSSLNSHLGGTPSATVAVTPSNTPATAPAGDAAQKVLAGRRTLGHMGTRKNRRARPMATTPPESPDKRGNVPSPIEGIPQPLSPVLDAEANIADFSPDLIRDSYEGELSKFPLDGKASQERILLRLVGLCRWRGHYIVKITVENQTAEDFFVKELAAYEGSRYVTLKSYFRLLVEPGRTREGHVLFDAHTGSKVKIALKEDRESGRVMEVPVRYPF